MKRVVLVVLLFVAFAVAGTSRTPADYAITVRVTTSRMVVHHAYFQQLSVLIDGKQYELESELPHRAVLTLGDYRARLAEDRKSEFEVLRVYELLLPDNEKRRFIVMEIKP